MAMAIMTSQQLCILRLDLQNQSPSDSQLWQGRHSLRVLLQIFSQVTGSGKGGGIVTICISTGELTML